MRATSVSVVRDSSDGSLVFSTFLLGGGGSVAIGQFAMCTSDIAMGAGIMYCTRNRL